MFVFYILIPTSIWNVPESFCNSKLYNDLIFFIVCDVVEIYVFIVILLKRQSKVLWWSDAIFIHSSSCIIILFCLMLLGLLSYYDISFLCCSFQSIYILKWNWVVCIILLNLFRCLCLFTAKFNTFKFCIINAKSILTLTTLVFHIYIY